MTEEAEAMIGATFKVVRTGTLPPTYVAAVEEIADQVLGWE